MALVAVKITSWRGFLLLDNSTYLKGRHMGREIRRVPMGWEHPKNDNGEFQPMHDENAEAALSGWMATWEKWKATELAEVIARNPAYGYKIDEPYKSFCSYHGAPPDAEYYHPKWPEGSATAYQMYETVSEGTPTSPVFATLTELEDYLVNHGDFWDQNRGEGGWSREAAQAFCSHGHAFTMVMTQGRILTPRDAEMYNK